MSDDMKRVCAALDRNVWDGLVEYANHRHGSRKSEAIDAKDWDAVRFAQGGADEVKKLARLRAEFESYVAERNTALKSP